ncbi:MAG: 50S ribosome-binding GTPase [Myxococcales bacterium]|nr:50S ribosome-binding GTPase [Myxococcales bacterium]
MADELRSDIEGFLARHEAKELVRFTTVGSVDDGKSTLIGRMLHDVGAVFDDQLRAVKKATATRLGDEEIDFSLFTDGLIAEREQGITIDVAYRYFSTETRKFIIADTPGHEQYTRNMATGASTADIAIILLDARLGVLPQSKRHAAIASLLGISQLIVAVNKMDLADYAEARFDELRREFAAFTDKLRFDGVHFVPVSAKKGDNVVAKSERTPWYAGLPLLGLLESLPVRRASADEPFRFPVQTVIRPHLDYRGFAGWVARGIVRVGDEVTVLPSGRTTKVAGIDTFKGPLTHAAAPLSVTLRLTDEVDVSRGEMIVAKSSPPTATVELEASLVWLSERAHEPTRRLLLKHTSRWVPARIASLVGKLSLSSLELLPATGIELNDIVRVRLSTARPIFCDPYREGRDTGAFILVDAIDNSTVAAGMVEAPRKTERAEREGPVDAAERAERLGHRSALVRVSTDGVRLERALFLSEINALFVGHTDVEAVSLLIRAGTVVLIEAVSDETFLSLARAVAPAPAIDLRASSGDLARHVVAVVTGTPNEVGGSGI